MLYKITLIFLVIISTIQAEEYAVVINSKNPETKTDHIRDYFLLNLTDWKNGQKIIPIDIAERKDETNRHVKKAFLKSVLKMTFGQYTAHWTDQKSGGKTVRPVIASDFNEVKKIILKRVGAIGYIPRDIADGNIKILKTFSVKNKKKR